jgi:hypothetical protein
VVDSLSIGLDQKRNVILIEVQACDVCIGIGRTCVVLQCYLAGGVRHVVQGDGTLLEGSVLRTLGSERRLVTLTRSFLNKKGRWNNGYVAIVRKQKQKGKKHAAMAYPPSAYSLDWLLDWTRISNLGVS